MKTRFTQFGLLALSLGVVGCSGSQHATPPGSSVKPDMAQLQWGDLPDAGDPGDDMADPNAGTPDNCGDPGQDPACIDVQNGPPNKPFPLGSDPMKDPNYKDQGVNRDPNGYLALDSTHSSFNYVWIANSQENTTSKIDSKTVRELARYPTYTCFSLKTGSSAQCDGTNGCCAIDDWPRYQARKNKQQQPGHQQVLTSNLSPSRTSVDFNGDLFISNRAFGGQSSVTKIANELVNCIDRNHNGKIETSSDTSGNGWIETDCNGDGQPDDINSVKGKPCNNGLKQEYYGVDDECVVWTSNTFDSNMIGRPLGLGPGAVDSGSSDAWAGSYQSGIFVRIDGKTGLDKDDTKVGNNPYGLAVDATGIAWAGPLGGPTLCYFDTNKSSDTACARTPQGFSVSGYGVTLDRDQNVWIGSGVMRYTPDRSNKFANLGNGFWMKIQGANGIGIAADSRNMNDYYVWSCNGNGVLQIPASTIPMPGKKGQALADWQVAPNGWTTINMPCYGVGVDSDQNVWGVNMSTSTRALVDAKGVVTQPKVNGQPMGNNKCPAGDSCPNAGAYTYSDFTGFGLRNFTRPQGTYSALVKGCSDQNGGVTDTDWRQVVWDAAVPPNTSMTVVARSGNSAMVGDGTWGQPTAVANASPLDLSNGNLVPNLDQKNDGYLWVEFTFKSLDNKSTPRLKSFDVGFKCSVIP